MTKNEAINYVNKLKEAVAALRQAAKDVDLVGKGTAALALVANLVIPGAQVPIGAVAALEILGGAWLNRVADSIENYAAVIARNTGDNGVIIGATCYGRIDCEYTVINRDNGNGEIWTIAKIQGLLLFGTASDNVFVPGKACTLQGKNPGKGNYWVQDHVQCWGS